MPRQEVGSPTERENDNDIQSSHEKRCCDWNCLADLRAWFRWKSRSIGDINYTRYRRNFARQRSIHQEVIIKTSPARVYRALTNEKEFARVINFVMSGSTAQISPVVGGSFSIFNGIILGRHIEMDPNKMLVQAWREKNWEPGSYSVVRFATKPARCGYQAYLRSPWIP